MQAARGAALTPPAGEPGAGRQVRVLLSVAVAVYVLDLVSKVIVVATLSHHLPVRLLGGLLTLRLLRNSGAAFSIGTSMTVVFTLIAVGVIGMILRASRLLRSRPWAITLGLLLGGATGNLTDRLLRSPGVFRGDVVDWIELPHWPVFNVADSAIVCGGILAVLLAAWGIRMDGGREGQPRQEDPAKPPTEPPAGPSVDQAAALGGTPVPAPAQEKGEPAQGSTA
ncbi:MAG TPA: signal peptidase II [Streptosporangiaceae bacterium]|nr:signal peptidase II [Streptosporangiaceae bacterium]